MQAVSPYLLAIFVGWIVAQGLKYAIVVIRTRNFNHLRQLYVSGHMPSAHTFTVMALATVVALRDGIDSALFGIAALLAGIVMYDAMMVRRSVGEQGVALHALIREQKSKVVLQPTAKGHKPSEVAVGFALGVLIGLVVFLATK